MFLCGFIFISDVSERIFIGSFLDGVVIGLQRHVENSNTMRNV